MILLENRKNAFALVDARKRSFAAELHRVVR